MLQDLKDACRALAKSKWFTCVTVLTLALGIGANTAIFGVVNRLMLNPLPYADADELVYLNLNMRNFQGEGFIGFPAPNSVVAAWRDEARLLDRIESSTSVSVLAYDDNGGRVLRGMRITPGLPGLLGVAPLLGRGFTRADAEPGAPAVVMLNHEVWQRDDGGVKDVLGRAITLDEVPHVIVGVMPPRWDAFTGRSPEVVLPLSLASAGSPGGFLASEAIARLRPGVDRDAVRRELDPILARAQADLPRGFFGNEPATARVERPADRINASTRAALLVLFGAVGLVLLVACSNVANLLLARSAARARELALRSALGASGWRLARALFAECLVLALAAGAIGVALGWVTLRVLARLRPNTLSALGEVQVDSTVVAYTFGLSAVTALLFGLAPALQLRSRKLADALRHGASGTVRGGSGARVRKLLVVAQMAMSVVLLVSAGLLLRSVIHLQNVDLGFDADNLFTAQLTMPRGRYQEAASRDLLLEQLVARLRSSPGVVDVTQALYGPPNFMAMVGGEFEIRGVPVSEADVRAPKPTNSVQPNYFATLGIRLLEGRTFTADEAREGAAVLLVSEATARHFWPDGNAVGGEIRLGREWRTVIGVVDNVAASPTQPRDGWQFYMASKQDRLPPGAGAPSLTLLVRAVGDPAAAMAVLRAAARELDPEIAIPSLLLTETALAATFEGPRFNMALLIAFAVIALMLAAVGLAAVIGYEITERTHEIGIRMALGARTENVRRLAMRHGLRPALIGVVIGVIGALGATQLAASLLYGVTPRDPLTFAAVVALLLAVALGASWLPARRATRVEPIIALRAD
jgi:putative ABC transport system permease protein